MIIENIKRDNGFTLLAVIIIVIILLILAGVSISQINNSDGLLEKSQTSVAAYKEKEIKEKVELKIYNLNVDKIAKTKEKANLQDVLELKGNDNEIIDSYKDGDNVILVIDDYQCEVDKNLEVTSVNLNVNNTGKLKQIKRELTFCTFDREEN